MLIIFKKGSFVASTIKYNFKFVGRTHSEQEKIKKEWNMLQKNQNINGMFNQKNNSDIPKAS